MKISPKFKSMIQIIETRVSTIEYVSKKVWNIVEKNGGGDKV